MTPDERMSALVIFGATGDLAKLETFPALVGQVERKDRLIGQNHRAGRGFRC